MRVKAILQSLLLAYGLTGILLLLLAFVLFRFEPGENAAAAGIIFIYVASCLAGGITAGRIMRKDRLAVSFLAQGKWDMTFAHAVTTFFMCLGGGALGGMLS